MMDWLHSYSNSESLILLEVTPCLQEHRVEIVIRLILRLEYIIHHIR